MFGRMSDEVFSKQAIDQAQFIHDSVRSLMRDAGGDSKKNALSMAMSIAGAAMQEAYDLDQTSPDVLYHGFLGLLHTLHAKVLAEYDERDEGT